MTMLLNDLLVAGVLNKYQLVLPVSTESKEDMDFGFTVSDATTLTDCYLKFMSTYEKDNRPEGIPNTAKRVQVYFAGQPPADLVPNSKAQVLFDGSTTGWLVYSSLQHFAVPLTNQILGQTLEGWYWLNV